MEQKLHDEWNKNCTMNGTTNCTMKGTKIA